MLSLLVLVTPPEVFQPIARNECTTRCPVLGPRRDICVLSLVCRSRAIIPFVLLGGGRGCADYVANRDSFFQGELH